MLNPTRHSFAQVMPGQFFQWSSQE
jgi:hypothetical protein